jgi:hypothetical protein
MPQITKTLSPFEQNIIAPLFEELPRKARPYVKRWSTQILPAFALTYVTMRWADNEFERLMREHWD